MSLNITKNTLRNYFSFITVVLLIWGFLYSRAFHSVGLLLMGLIWLSNYKQTLWLFKDKWFISLFFIICCVPVFDYINGNVLDNAFFIKLSIPLYPLFFFSWNPDAKKISYLNKIIFFLLFLLSMETLIRYIFNFEAINDNYKIAKVIPIGFYSDHIRISVFIALSCLLALYEIFENSITKVEKVILITYVCFEVIFLHFLVARTGLIALYVALTIFFSYRLIKYNARYFIYLLAFLITLPVISMKLIPSFYNRMGFVMWDKSYYERMEYREGSSDGLRYYSIKAGIDIFKNNVTHGVGFHNLRNESFMWLKNKFPEIKDYELLQPSSEFIIYAASGGILCLLFLIIYTLLPFFDKELLKNEYFTSVYFALFVTFLFEIFLENQYGVFVFGFFSYWAYFIVKKSKPVNPSID